jgi:hypothetical protein
MSGALFALIAVAYFSVRVCEVPLQVGPRGRAQQTTAGKPQAGRLLLVREFGINL